MALLEFSSRRQPDRDKTSCQSKNTILKKIVFIHRTPYSLFPDFRRKSIAVQVTHRNYLTDPRYLWISADAIYSRLLRLQG